MVITSNATKALPAGLIEIRRQKVKAAITHQGLQSG
jgi:hypothetical protein